MERSARRAVGQAASRYVMVTHAGDRNAVDRLGLSDEGHLALVANLFS